MARTDQDPSGQAMMDFLDGQDVHEIIERDDGMIAVSGGPRAYFSEYPDWSRTSKEALTWVRGRVLDLGCGAGRVALHLQDAGHEVVGIDVSPGALEVARRRGVKDTRLLSVTRVDPSLGTFDTIVMFGNNLGLLGNEKRARWLLRRFHRVTGSEGRIVAEAVDPYKTEEEEHLAYHRSNRERGRMAGQVRVRVRYRRARSDWFDWLLVSKEELEGLLEGTGWYLGRALSDESPVYYAILDRA
jgi:SAM-dependent methyltransferase